MIIKDTVEERIVDLQDRKRELANVTIEGKTAAAKLTMKDMMGLFGRDAEARYNGGPEIVDLAQKTRILTSATESSHSGSQNEERSSHGSYSGSRDRNRQPEKRAPRSEDSVYGRRW